MKKNVMWIIIAIVLMCTTLGIGVASLTVGMQNSYLKSQNDKLSNINKELTDVNNNLDSENKELNNNQNQSNQQIEDLNSSLKDLQDIVDQYGQTLSIVLFEVNGETFSTEVVEKGGEVELPELPDTETTYFQGWKINGKGNTYRGTYVCTQPTKFIASIVNKAVVNFVYNGETSTSYYKHGTNITLPVQENTATQYYNGWKVNGESESIKGIYTVNHDVSLTLDMMNKAVVNFIIDGVIIETQYVIHGDAVVLPNKPDGETKYFNGWKIDGTGETLKGNYQITEDTNFVIDMVNDPIVKFVVNGNIEQVVSVKHGENVTLPTKEDTSTQYFNGWKIEGEGGSYLGSYTVTKDVTFVLDMINHPVVTYSVDNKVVEKLLVKHGDVITMPTRPDSETQYYNGWKVEGVGASYNDTYKVTRDVNFILDMVNKAVVSYQVDGKITGSEYVKHGETITLPTKPNTETEFYNGWKVDGVGDSFKKYTVTSDVVLVLDMTTDNAWVLTDDIDFKFNASSFAGRYVWNCGQNVYFSEGNVQYFLNKSTYVWEPKTWNGVTSFDGDNVWTDGTDYYLDSSYVLDGDTWSRVTWNGLTSFSADNIWKAGDKIYYSSGETHYELTNKSTRTWSAKTWTGLTSFDGKNVWGSSDKIFYSKLLTVSNGPYGSSGSAEHYVLNIATDTWSTTTVFGSSLFNGYSGWTMDGKIWYFNEIYKSPTPYFSGYYTAFNLETMSFTTSFSKQFYGYDVWSDGKNFYLSSAVKYTKFDNPYGQNATVGQYRIRNNELIPIMWKGLFSDNYSIINSAQYKGQKSYEVYLQGDTLIVDYIGDLFCYLFDTKTSYGKQLGLSISPEYIWTDGLGYYYSYGSEQYQWIECFGEWIPVTWSGLTKIYSKYIWTDGTNTYYSDDDDQYILKENYTWEPMTWTGLTSFYGYDVWTDGTNIYYSNYSTQYILDKKTHTWSQINWGGLTYFISSYIWTDGTDYYYSKGLSHYVLDKDTHTWSEMTWNGLTNFQAKNVFEFQENIYVFSNGFYKLNNSRD